MRYDRAHIDERMARLESTVAIALGHTFPELMACPEDTGAAERHCAGFAAHIGRP